MPTFHDTLEQVAKNLSAELTIAEQRIEGGSLPAKLYFEPVYFGQLHEVTNGVVQAFVNSGLQVTGHHLDPQTGVHRINYLAPEGHPTKFLRSEIQPYTTAMPLDRRVEVRIQSV